MLSWSHLPVEIKQHVAKKLDFMSRHSLKSTSHGDRQIVNSTNIKIPRVRFGYKESKCLIMIYTGIEKFLRLELSECKSGVIIHKSENSWDPKDISIKIVRTTDALKLGISILKSLLSHKSIIIEAMEWELTKLDDENANKKQNKRLLKHFDGAKFRVKEMVVMFLRSIDTLSKLCFMDELKCFRNIEIVASRDNLVPVVAHDYQFFKIEGIPICITRLCLTTSAAQFSAITQVGCAELRKQDDVRMASSRGVRMRENYKNEFKIEEENGLRLYCHTTKCGGWTHRMRAEYVDQVKLQFDFESKKCGLGPLCKQCSDPFEYWYQQTLPRRLIYEPFWDGVFLRFEFENDAHRETEFLRNKLARDEKEKEKIQKGKNIQKTSDSWGFRELPIDDTESDDNSENLETFDDDEYSTESENE